MKGHFFINLKVGEENYFSVEKNNKGIREWEEIYLNNPDAEEFKVYATDNNGQSYSLIYSVYKRKIGF